MKTKDIQRGIQSPLRRRSGDSPRLGEVVRMRQPHVTPEERSNRSGRRRGRGADPERKARVLAWSALLGLASLVVIGLTISMWLVPQLRRKSEKSEGDMTAHEAKVRVASKFSSPNREEALELVRLALANRDPGKIDSFFRKGSASSSEILEFLNGMEAKDGQIVRYDWLSSMDSEGLLVDGVLVVAKGGDRPAERIAFLTPDATGKWKLDFDAFARTVRPSWEELLAKGADHAMVRVVVSTNVYYNGPFQDEAQWVCYGMVSPDTEELLRGYCRVGSKEAESLKKLFANGDKMGRATLEIRRVKDGEARQFEIIRVLARDWIVADAPDSGS